MKMVDELTQGRRSGPASSRTGFTGLTQGSLEQMSKQGHSGPAPTAPAERQQAVGVRHMTEGETHHQLRVCRQASKRMQGLQPVPTVATQLNKPAHQFLHDQSLQERQHAGMQLCAGCISSLLTASLHAVKVLP